MLTSIFQTLHTTIRPNHFRTHLNVLRKLPMGSICIKGLLDNKHLLPLPLLWVSTSHVTPTAREASTAGFCGWFLCWNNSPDWQVHNGIGHPSDTVGWPGLITFECACFFCVLQICVFCVLGRGDLRIQIIFHVKPDLNITFVGFVTLHTKPLSLI